MTQRLDQLMDRFKTIVHDELSLKMKSYAQEMDIPIIEEPGLELMLQLIRIKQPKTILEIGSAIGYSAMMMARHLPQAEIVTIERDPSRYQAAVSFLQHSNVCDRVVIFNEDALEMSTKTLPVQKFDVIFIDAAKAQYRKFFEKYEPFLKEDGMIISDNLMFHGYVFDDNIQSRNLKQLIRKIKNYNSWLAENPNYDTILIPIGDGVAVSRKKTEVAL